MPRKTRKQKEKTREKRLTETSSDRPGTSPVKGEFEFQFSLPNTAKKTAPAEKDTDNSVRFKDTGTANKDLTKTVVLAVIIFALELVIYSRWFK